MMLNFPSVHNLTGSLFAKFAFAIYLLFAFSSRAAAAELVVHPIDTEATGYATFQSHNQKIIFNQHGIFFAYIRSRNEEYTAQQWRLARSTDNGATFQTLHEATNATNPPVLESDAAGNVYLIRPDFADNNAYLYRFLAAKDFTDAQITTIPGAAAGKYAMMIDEPRGQLYFFSHNNTFHIIGLDGVLRSSVTLLQQGPNAVLQYPLLSLAEDGTLHAAWTTQKHGIYLYWDIHHMLSKDGGKSWQNLDAAPLTLPVVADDTGPATRISLDDEFESHTWLSSFMVKGGKLHFAYLAQTTPPRQHYVRYDIATARREIDIQPQWRGADSPDASIQTLDGFFSTPNQRADSPLYFTGGYQGRVVMLVSNDNGTTWLPHAHSAASYAPYAITGPRQTLPDGSIIGAFTQTTSTDTQSKATVYFFHN